MNYTLFVTMAIFVNTFLAVLFPTQLGLDDPFGLEEIRQQKFESFDTNTQQYFIEQEVFNPDGTPGENFDTFKDLQTSGEEEAGISQTETGLNFFDWSKIVLTTIQNIGIFTIAFIVIIFQLPLSIGIYLGPILLTLGILSLGKFIMGR